MPNWARLPDQETEYSDWQIDVKFRKDDGTHDVSYLVHRFRLGEESNYFKRICGDNETSFTESHENRSSIELPVFQEDFELFLDYLYAESKEKKSFIKEFPDSNLALLYLTDYFDLPEARDNITVNIILRITSKASGEWLARVYVMAETLSIPEILFRMTQIFLTSDKFFCKVLDNLPTTDSKSRLLQHLSTLMMNGKLAELLPEPPSAHCRGPIRSAHSRGPIRPSINQNEYLKLHTGATYAIGKYPDIVDDEVFNQIDLPAPPSVHSRGLARPSRITQNEYLKLHTSATYAIEKYPDIVDEEIFNQIDLRFITAENAIVYLEHEHRLGLDGRAEGGLTYLQKRCINKISTETKPEDIASIGEKLKGLNSNVLVSLLVRTMEDRAEIKSQLNRANGVIDRYKQNENREKRSKGSYLHVPPHFLDSKHK